MALTAAAWLLGIPLLAVIARFEQKVKHEFTLLNIYVQILA